LCTPPDKEEINPAILFAANLCGVTKILKVGGIQAIAGMTFGINSKSIQDFLVLGTNS
jgi:histidinol dehydrogenase